MSTRPAWLVHRAPRLLLALSLLSVGSVLLTTECSHTESAAHRAARLSQENGIEIRYGDPDTFFVPPYGSQDARIPGIVMYPTDEASASLALTGIEQALSQYPPGTVAKLIKAIFISGQMRVRSSRAGGTYGPAWIILAAPVDLGPEGIRATSYIGLHHELSSIIYRRSPALQSKWQAFQPTGRASVEEGEAALKHSNESAPDPATGFLSAYGATNPEDDFNVYAEKIFTEAATVSQLVRRYPVIRLKVNVVVAAYVAVDPRFAATFRDLRLQ